MKIQPIYLIGGAVAAYLLLSPSTSATPGASLVSTLLPPATPAVPTTYGINNGVLRSPASSHPALPTNYAALVAANPELLNSGHIFTAAEQNQYTSNYLDLQQGIKPFDAAHIQLHWKNYGVAGQYIFLPLIPPSTWPLIPAPATSSSGSGWLSILGDVASVAVAVAGIGDTVQLTPVDQQIMFAAGWVLSQILPMYEAVDPNAGIIDEKFNDIMKNYI